MLTRLALRAMNVIKQLADFWEMSNDSWLS